MIEDKESVFTRPLLIMIGLTGTGKTTTVKALQNAGLEFLLLPNRRELTDRFIIQYLQELDGEPVAPVTDRTKRFAYTRRFRDLYPGGMAEALFRYLVSSNQYSVNGKQLSVDNNRLLVFDGLRGENEITYAVRLFPKAHFLFLQAPDFVRVQRLVKRQDAFDAVTIAGEVDKPALSSGHRARVEVAVLYELAKGILTDHEIEQLILQVGNGEIAADELHAKLTIVLAERQNYDPEATLTALQNLAPDRLILSDTVVYSPAEIARDLTAKFAKNAKHIR